MKFLKALGGVLCFLGGLAALLGIAATAAPMIENAQVSRVIDSFSVPSQDAWRGLLNAAALFCLNRNYLLFGAGIGVLLIGGLMKTGAGKALYAAHTSAPAAEAPREETPAKAKKEAKKRKPDGAKPAPVSSNALQPNETAQVAPPETPRWTPAVVAYRGEESETEKTSAGVLGAAIVQRIQTGRAEPGLPAEPWHTADVKPESSVTPEPWEAPKVQQSVDAAAARPAGTDWYRKTAVSEPETTEAQPRIIVPEPVAAPRVNVTPREIYIPRVTQAAPEPGPAPVAAPYEPAEPVAAYIPPVGARKPVAPVLETTAPPPQAVPEPKPAPEADPYIPVEPVASFMPVVDKPKPSVPAKETVVPHQPVPEPKHEPETVPHVPAESFATPAPVAGTPKPSAPARETVVPPQAAPEPKPTPEAAPYRSAEPFATFAPAASALTPSVPARETAAPQATQEPKPAPETVPHVPAEPFATFVPAANAPTPSVPARETAAPQAAQEPKPAPYVPVVAAAFGAGQTWNAPERRTEDTQYAKAAPAAMGDFTKPESTANAENRRIAERWQPQPVRALKTEKQAGGMQAAYTQWETKTSPDERVIVATRRPQEESAAVPAPQWQPPLEQPPIQQPSPIRQPLPTEQPPTQPQPQQPPTVQPPMQPPLQQPPMRPLYPQPAGTEAPASVSFRYPAPRDERPIPEAAYRPAPPVYTAGGLNAAYVPEPPQAVRSSQPPEAGYAQEYYDPSRRPAIRNGQPSAPQGWPQMAVQQGRPAMPVYPATGAGAVYPPAPVNFVVPQQAAPAYAGLRPQPYAGPPYAQPYEPRGWAGNGGMPQGSFVPEEVTGGGTAPYVPEPADHGARRPPAAAYAGEYFAPAPPYAAPPYGQRSAPADGYRPNEARVYPSGNLGAARAPEPRQPVREMPRIVSTIEHARFDEQTEAREGGSYAVGPGYAAPQSDAPETGSRIVSTVGRKSTR